jgi:dienelactone hydrolase
VLLPDKRGSEQSRGNWRTASLDELATDTVAAIRYLRHQDHVPISRIGIVGMSQGGHIAPLVASKSSEVAFVVNVVGSATPLRNGLVYEENHNLRELGFLPGVSNVVARLSTTYLVRVGQKDFWNAIGDLDPIAHWQTLTVPALVLYGENDTNVNSSESAARLRSLEKPNIDVAVYAGSGHALEDPPEQGNSIFREDALDRITTFIHSATSDAR